MQHVTLDEQLAALQAKATDAFSRSCLEGARLALAKPDALVGMRYKREDVR